MPSISQTQGLLANQNPNIISSTYTGNAVTGQGGTATTPPAGAPPRIPEYNSPPATPVAVPQIPGLAQANDVAQNMSTQMYQGGMVPGLESQRDADLKSLYDYDSMLGQVYGGQSYFPQVEGYVDNPADRVQALAGISGATAGQASRTSGTIDVVERAYNTAISNVLDRFMSFAQLQEQARQHNESMALEREKIRGTTNKSAEAIAALFGSDPATALQGMEVVPDNYPGQVSATQIKFSDAQKRLTSGAAGAPTYNNFLAAIKIDPDNASKYQSMYQDAVKNLNPVANLTAAQQDKVAAINTLTANFKDIEDKYYSIPSWQKGPALQGVGSTLSGWGVSPEVKTYQALSEAMIGPIARIISSETGPLNEGDIQRAKKMLPNSSDSVRDAQAKITQLKSMMANQAAAFQGATGATNLMATLGNQTPPSYPELPTNTMPTQPVLATPTTPPVATPEPTIKVMKLTDPGKGKVGDIPASEFNPKEYVKVRI